MSNIVSSELGSVPTVHTLDEAAALLRVKKSWLERQAAARKVPFTMLGGAYHFTSNHLAAIVRLHEVEPCGHHDPAKNRPRYPGPSVSDRRGPAAQQASPHTLTAAPLRSRPRTGPRRAA